MERVVLSTVDSPLGTLPSLKRVNSRSNAIDDRNEFAVSMNSIIEFLATAEDLERWRNFITDNGHVDFAFQNIADSQDDFKSAVYLFREIMSGDLKMRKKRPAKEACHALHSMDYIIVHLNEEDEILDWLTVGIPDGSDWDEIEEIVNDTDEFVRIVGVFISYANKGFTSFVVGNQIF